MSDELTVSGGGSIAVSSDELLGMADRASAVARELESIAAELRGGGWASNSPWFIDTAMSIARRLDTTAACVASLAHGLRLVAAAYGTADAIAHRLAQDAAATLGWTIGAAAGGIAVFATPFTAPVLLGVGASAMARPDEAGRVVNAVGKSSLANLAWLSDAAMIDFLRLAIASLDDVILGSLGIGAVTARTLGDEGVGISGLDRAAALTTALASRSGPLAETRVEVKREPAGAGTVAPPVGIADRIDRIPTGAAHVRIDRFDVGDADGAHGELFEVYIGGTRDFGLVPGVDPWDMTSNVRGVAGIDAGSLRAVRDAMTDAGITKDSPVVFTGYSQGGLIATRLAASPEYSTRGLVTIGAPAGQVPIPGTIPAIVIEHTDDLVPATGGIRRDGGTAVTVRRNALAGRPLPHGVALPAHALPEYRATAALADRAIDPRLVRARQELAAATATSTATASVSYRAERVRDGR